MVQVLQRPPSWQEQLGAGLGSGISSGLQQLAQQKLQQLQRGQAAKGLQSLGFDPQEAMSISGLDPSIQREIVKQRLAAPQQEAFGAALNQLLGGASPGQELKTGMLEPLNQLSQAQQQQPSFAQTLQGLNPMQLMEAINMGTVMGGPPQEQAAFQQQMAPQQAVAQEMPRALPQPISIPRLTEKQATTLAKLGLQKQQLTQKERAEAFKLTKPERKEIIEKARASRMNLKDLDRLEELEKEGKLDTPGYVEFLKRSGFDIPALMNPGSEEYQKIAQTFMRDAKNYLGSRISNFELEQFLKTIPSLSQSPEGRKRVIANLKYVNRGALEYNNAMKEVIAENQGIPPLDLAEKIDDKVDKKLDIVARKFREDLKKPVPKGQNKFITALQTTLGSAIGGITGGGLKGAAKGALIGAGIGSTGVGIGAGPGAALGGLAGLTGLI